MQDKQLSRVRILLVDDNEHTLALFCRILRGLSIRQVATVENALDALKELRENPVDIMITDLAMDPVDGLTLVELIRNADDSPNPDLRIIMLTGYPEAENEEAAQKAGVDAFLRLVRGPVD